MFRRCIRLSNARSTWRMDTVLTARDANSSTELRKKKSWPTFLSHKHAVYLTTHMTTCPNFVFMNQRPHINRVLPNISSLIIRCHSIVRYLSTASMSASKSTRRSFPYTKRRHWRRRSLAELCNQNSNIWIFTKILLRGSDALKPSLNHPMKWRKAITMVTPAPTNTTLIRCSSRSNINLSHQYPRALTAGTYQSQPHTISNLPMSFPAYFTHLTPRSKCKSNRSSCKSSRRTSGNLSNN